MVKNKGIGYIIEAFVSSLVILIFVLSSYSTITLNDQNSQLENRIMAEDASHTLHKTGYMEKMMKNGDADLLSKVSSGVTKQSSESQVTYNGPPVGQYSIGIYTENGRLKNSSVEPLTSDDRCYGDLNETNSEFTPVHTNSSSQIESIHGIRIYFTDRDSLTADSSRYNGVRDFDSFYIDRNEKCQFSLDEGPFNLREHVTLENNTVKTYQINNVKNNKFYYYETPLASDIEEMFSRYSYVEIDIDNVNFSSDYQSQDLLIFSENDTLKEISSNKNEFNEYAEDGSILLAMSLNRTNVNNGVFSNTGLGWVNLTKTASADRKTTFKNNRDSQRIKNYLNKIGYRSSQINLETGGNVSSLNSGAIKSNSLMESSNFRYKTDKWDYLNSSLIDDDNFPENVKEISDCSDTHRKGTFKFPSRAGKERLTVYNTKLNGEKTQCELLGLSIDKNDNGEIEESETTFLDGDKITINEREYTVSINNHESVEFVYSGNNRVEYLVYRTEFKDGHTGKIARLPEIDSNSPDSHKGLLTASSLYLLEGEKTIGQGKDSGGFSSTIIASTEVGIHEITMRWFN